MTDAKRTPNGRGSQALTTAVSAALAVPGVASAQSAGALEEIVVTATRRAERLQDVPQSISAFDAAAIEKRGMKQFDDYAKFIPGMSISDREPGATTIIFRGVAASGLQFGAVASSALYLDEQPITQSGRNPDPRLIDIERVEALRGPQGSLYGASSQSGTLRVITNKPDPKEFDGWVDAQLSQIDGGDTGYDVAAMVNIPLASDRLALRLVGFTSEDAGFIDNVLGESQGGTFDNSNVVKKNVNSTTTSGGRAALRWDVTDNVDVTLGAIFQDVDNKGASDVNLFLGDLQQTRFEKETMNDKWYQVALTLNATLPFGQAVVAASYFDRDFRYEADATDYEFNFNQYYTTCVAYYGANNCYATYDFGGDPRGHATNHEKVHITTLEARLQSIPDGSSRWSWLVGAFYSRETGKTEFDSYIRNYQDTGSFYYFSYYNQRLTGNPLDPTEKWYVGLYDTELDQVAGFGELSFDITQNFTITAGGRYFEYDRKFAQIQEQPEGFVTLNGDQKTSESGNVLKLNLTYRLDDSKLVYATYSEGFRVGGSNPLKPRSILPRDYRSDQLDNYEIGLKSDWLDHRLRLNLAAYYMKWNDFAVQIEDPQPAFFQLGYVNLPAAEITGIEGEFAAALTSSWQIEGAFSYNDAKTSRAATFSGENEDGDVFSFTVQKDARLPLTPDWTATIGIEYRAQTRWLDAQPYARFDYAYVGDSVNSLEGIESVVSGRPVDTQHAYDTGDLRFGLDGDSWSAALFIDNVWDERAELFYSNRWALQRLSVNRPRTFGVQLRYHF
jgi:iron complex outermembrane recepter protein